MIGVCRLCGAEVRSDIVQEWHAVKHLDIEHEGMLPTYVGGLHPEKRRRVARDSFVWRPVPTDPEQMSEAGTN
jgi:hypothetical protein